MGVRDQFPPSLTLSMLWGPCLVTALPPSPADPPEASAIAAVKSHLQTLVLALVSPRHRFASDTKQDFHFCRVGVAWRGFGFQDTCPLLLSQRGFNPLHPGLSLPGFPAYTALLREQAEAIWAMSTLQLRRKLQEFRG